MTCKIASQGSHDDQPAEKMYYWTLAKHIWLEVTQNLTNYGGNICDAKPLSHLVCMSDDDCSKIYLLLYMT